MHARPKSVVLKFECAPESVGEFVKTQVAGVSDLAGLGWAQEFAFLRVADVENKLMVMGGGEGEGIRKIGIDTYTLLCLKLITNKDLLYSTGNSIQYSAMPIGGKNLKQSEHMYMYNRFTLLKT